jgi:hypothetical protein
MAEERLTMKAIVVTDQAAGFWGTDLLLSQGAVGFAAVTGMNCPGSIFPSRTV